MADKYTVFADESGTHPSSSCFSIGALVIPNKDFDYFNQQFWQLKTKHRVQNELHWKNFRNSYGRINLAIDLLRLVRSHSFQFSCIVVRKSTYRKWHAGNEEEAFYSAYTLLMKHRCKVEGDYQVVMDDRQDRYDKQHEVVQIITNHMLQQLDTNSRLLRVSKGDSRLHSGIQVADILTGAITSASHRFLKKSFDMHPGKQLAIDRLAAVLGWDDLAYDTWPNSDFNIWHFPYDIKWRGTPASKSDIGCFEVPYVGPQELERVCAQRQ